MDKKNLVFLSLLTHICHKGYICNFLRCDMKRECGPCASSTYACTENNINLPLGEPGSKPVLAALVPTSWGTETG